MKIIQCKTCGQIMVDASPTACYCYTNSQEIKEKRNEIVELMRQHDIKAAKELLVKAGYTISK